VRAGHRLVNEARCADAARQVRRAPATPPYGGGTQGEARMTPTGRALFVALAIGAAAPAAAQVGGYEGASPSFNLADLCANAGGGSSTRCDDYGSGQFNCSNPRTGIGRIGEGGGRGAVFVDGKAVMTPN
jgi:hypothetical protein